MKELSLHILDIVQNSISAGSKNIKINICEDNEKNIFYVEIIDDGKGMDEERVKRAIDPFYTTRTTRKVGLGISLFKMAAETCDGNLLLESREGQGTRLKANFVRNHIDRAPLGKIEETMVTLLMGNDRVNYLYTHAYGNKNFKLDTKEIKKILDGVSLSDYDVLMWIKNYIKEGIEEIYK
ncbi:MAG: ATP-binding protein [Anaeromicrobium sp.]|jgi:anti-sigma regulatory factor (Ser/Thr protein kinase)|uniref:ATP-binding protein n=1 Tax=Anaeromicrobium sp. TaxID=1929132 RepID=UPI0025CC1115|nr:ATP-binding protein [Anaeromicrobium sp.]MCT4594935.1 ATP-binding protein [Anaeromicrobium sp.]